LSQDGRVLIVRATKKLLDRIGPPSLGEGEHSTTSMGQWYATALFWKPLLPLPAGGDDIAIAKAAARHGICLAPLSPMHLAPSPNQGLLLGSGRLAEHRIPGAVRTLPPRSRKPGHLIPSPPSGRDAADAYRAGRLAAALEWRAGHEPELNQTERAFLDASRAAAGRAQRRLQMVLAVVAALLLVAVTGGVVALINQHSASNQARVALARQLGAQAVNEPRLDRAMLLAREAVNLDPSPQTEGTLLATLQRNPAVIGTFALPVDLVSQLAVSPDGRTLAVSHFLINQYGYTDDPRVSLGDIRFYDPRTRALQRAPVPHFGGAEPPVYSSDGSLLAYPTDNLLPSIAVRDAHTLAGSGANSVTGADR
jgi:hypothetical protein